VFTTPYVVLRPGLAEWLAYFSGHSGATAGGVYERHMNTGKAHVLGPTTFSSLREPTGRTPSILRAFRCPRSRRHSEVNQWGFKQ